MEHIIYTIGHSNSDSGEFLDILDSFGVKYLADIRRFPRSRKNPQFNSESLAAILYRRGIGYLHAESLGGFRRARKNSPNTGWKNDSFRGYADYMLTEEFSRALEDLASHARRKTTVIMCAESLPWRCHRTLIADALVIRGYEVRHITGRNSVYMHKMTPFAKKKGGNGLLYK